MDEAYWALELQNVSFDEVFTEAVAGIKICYTTLLNSEEVVNFILRHVRVQPAQGREEIPKHLDIRRLQKHLHLLNHRLFHELILCLGRVHSRYEPTLCR